MGKRGPDRVPTPILAARGSWRAKTRPEEPQATGLPLRPPWLEEREQALWSELLPLLLAQDTVAEIDAQALAMLCRYYWTWFDAAQLATCVDPGTMEWVRLTNRADKAQTVVQRLMAKFGLSPGDRANLRIEHASAGDPSKAKFFGTG